MDNKPSFWIGVVGLEPRDVRLIEIVFQHSQYNPYDYRLVSSLAGGAVDILIVNGVDPAGLRALAQMRASSHQIPVIAALPRGVASPVSHAIAIDRLTMQLLPILNRVVEQELRTTAQLADQSALGHAAERPAQTASAAPASTSAPAAAHLGPSVAAPAMASPAGLPDAPRLRVLVVDDSAAVRGQLTSAFERMDMSCEAFESARLALERLEVQHFDLALLDVVMPDMDGYQLTREIRRNRRCNGLPVILLTSRASPFDLARGALAGCDAYLVKPVPFLTLEAAVAAQIRRSLAITDLTGLMTLTAPAPSSLAGRSVAAVPAVSSGVMARLFRR